MNVQKQRKQKTVSTADQENARSDANGTVWEDVFRVREFVFIKGAATATTHAHPPFSSILLDDIPRRKKKNEMLLYSHRTVAL